MTESEIEALKLEIEVVRAQLKFVIRMADRKSARIEKLKSLLRSACLCDPEAVPQETCAYCRALFE